AEYHVKLAKLRIVEKWPDRRATISRKIDRGEAHQRTRGDIEDIGYRKLTGKQQDETATGQRVIRQMAASGLMPAPVQDSAVQEYASQLGNRIARASDLRTPLHTAVLDSPEINAIGLPGGFLFVTSGLILAAETESELAGVLSREVAGIA